MRYKLYVQGPDNNSTYPECWGSTATSPGRLVREAPRLADLIEAAGSLGHDNWSIRDSRRREWMSPKEFWTRKAGTMGRDCTRLHAVRPGLGGSQTERVQLIGELP